MLKQISKNGVHTRLTDPSLFIFRSIGTDDDKCLFKFEVYPIGKYGTPEEIMKAMENENILLMEESGNTANDTVSLQNLQLL